MPAIHVVTVAAGESDMTLGEIARRSAILCGGRQFANTYVLIHLREKELDPLTGKTLYPRRMCVGKFLTTADRHLPEPQREQELLGAGTSWAEAFARAEIHLRGGNA